MRKKKFICLLFLVCCILLCSACGIQCSNNEEISHISTEFAEYSEIPTIDFTLPIDADGIIEYVDPYRTGNNALDDPLTAMTVFGDSAKAYMD